MGTGVSKTSKANQDVINETIPEENQSTSQEKSVTNVEKERNERFANPVVENNGESNVQCIPVVVNNPTNRPKFYYYPEKQVSIAPKETVFIATSQFPYKKPKIVLVRPRKPDSDTTIKGNRFQPISGDVYDRSRYKKYENNVTGQPEFYSDHVMHISKARYRSHQSVNNVRPTNNYPPDRIIPHRTVAELRRSSNTCPGEEARIFSGEQFSRFSVEIEPGVNRPPTPSPRAWFPVRRTDDYLVASSLLAGEQELDRRRSVGRDLHDF